MAPFNTVYINLNNIVSIEPICKLHQDFYQKNIDRPEIVNRYKNIPKELPSNGAVLFYVGGLNTPVYTVTPYKEIIEIIKSLGTVKEL